MSKESNAVILNVLQGNDWQPVTVKTVEDKFAKHTVLVDYDYLPGKHKRNETQTEIEASKCELDHLFQKKPQYIVLGKISVSHWTSTFYQT